MGLETIALVAGIASSVAGVGSAIAGMTGGEKKTSAASTATTATAETEEQKIAKKKTAIAALQKESDVASSASAPLAGSGTNVTQKTLLGL